MPRIFDFAKIRRRLAGWGGRQSDEAWTIGIKIPDGMHPSGIKAVFSNHSRNTKRK